MKKTTSVTKNDPRVDAVIAKASPFAKPILTYLRALVHEAVPAVTEEIKWQRPFFLVDGTIVCNMSPFKAHCSFGFWSADMTKVLAADGISGDEGSGSFGKLTSVDELPSKKVMLGYIRKAAELARSGESVGAMGDRKVKMSKPEIAMPKDLGAALAKSKQAKAAWEAFSPSCKREYLDWVTSAKRDETRAKRLAEAILMIAEGKSRNWKYQR